MGLKILVVATLFGCLGGTESSTDTSVNGVNPPRGVANDNVSIHGSGLSAGGTPTVTMNGLPCDIVSVSDAVVVIRVPLAATTGELTMSSTKGNWTLGTFFVGPTAPVPEVEPNDDIDGADATRDMGNRAGTGTLASSADRDHFRFESLLFDTQYTINVSPRVVDVIYVNGAEVTLDAGGNGVVDSGVAETLVVGLTGGTGDYTVSMVMNP